MDGLAVPRLAISPTAVRGTEETSRTAAQAASRSTVSRTEQARETVEEVLSVGRAPTATRPRAASAYAASGDALRDGKESRRARKDETEKRWPADFTTARRLGPAPSSPSARAEESLRSAPKAEKGPACRTNGRHETAAEGFRAKREGEALISGRGSSPSLTPKIRAPRTA